MGSLPALRSRPERAFESLYRKHVRDVYRYAFAVLANPADAEDVTQTTFLNAYRAFERGERPEKPLNWLIVIAHNVCRQRFRQAARRPTELQLNPEVADQFVVEEAAPTAEEIKRALGELAFNQRTALVLRELEGRSYAEIAEILGLSLGAVETLLFRARRAMREQLEGSLSCSEAEQAISRQLDGGLQRSQRGPLRSHLRSCPDCALLARRLRGQRNALRGFAVIPLPASLASFGGGAVTTTAGAGAALGGGLALKAAAVTAGALLVGGSSYEVVAHRPWRAPTPAHIAAAGTPVVTAAKAAPSASAVSSARRVRAGHPHPSNRAVGPPAVSSAAVAALARSRRHSRAAAKREPARGLGGQARASSPHSRSARSGPPSAKQIRPARGATSTLAHRQRPPVSAHSAAAVAGSKAKSHTTTRPTLEQRVAAECRREHLADPAAFTSTHGGQGGGQAALRRCLLSGAKPQQSGAGRGHGATAPHPRGGKAH